MVVLDVLQLIVSGFYIWLAWRWRHGIIRFWDQYNADGRLPNWIQRFRDLAPRDFQRRFGWTILVFLLASAFTNTWEEVGGGPTPVAPQGGINLQFAAHSDTARAIVESWGSAGKIPGMIASVWSDTTIFIPVYTFFMFGAAYWTYQRTLEVISRLKEQNYDPQLDVTRLIGGLVCRWFPFICAICDLAENLCLNAMMTPNDTTFTCLWLAPVCTVFSTLKMTLIAAVALYWLFLLRLNPDARKWWEVVRLTAASLIVPVMAYVVLGIGQGQEALRILGEDLAVMDSSKSSGAFIRLTMALSGVVILAITAGYTAFVLVRESGWVESRARRSDHFDGTAGAAWAEAHIPNTARAGTLILVTLALFRASMPFEEHGGVRQPSDWLTLWFAVAVGTLSVLVLLLQWMRREYNSSTVPGPGNILNVYYWWRRLLPSPHPNPRKPALFRTAQQSDRGRYIDKSWQERVVYILFFTAVPFGLTAATVLLAQGAVAFVTYFGAVFWMTVGASMIMSVFSLLALESLRTRIPIVKISVLCAVAFTMLGLNDNHDARTLHPPSKPNEQNPTDASPSGKLPDARLSFLQWLSRREDLAKHATFRAKGVNRECVIDYPVFFVAAQGGGIRATYQTAQTLAALQETNSHFAQHTFAISSVSGGSLGAAIFAEMAAHEGATLNQYGDVTGTRDGGKWVSSADAVAGSDLLALPIADTVMGDFLQAFIPCPIPMADRSRGLEYSLEEAWETQDNSFQIENDNPFRRSFYRSGAGNIDTAAPALFINSACVETGNRLVIASLAPTEPPLPAATPVAADKPSPNKLPVPGDKPAFAAKLDPLTGRYDDDGLLNERPCINGMQLLAGVAPMTDLPLSTAVVLSARYPIISSSGAIPERRVVPAADGSGLGRFGIHIDDAYITVKRRLVDAGYYENSGVTTLQDILAALDNSGLDKKTVATVTTSVNSDPTVTMFKREEPYKNIDTQNKTSGQQNTNEDAWQDVEYQFGLRFKQNPEIHPGMNVSINWHPVVLTLTFADGFERKFWDGRDDETFWPTDTKYLTGDQLAKFGIYPRSESTEGFAPIMAAIGSFGQHNELAHQRVEATLLHVEEKYVRGDRNNLVPSTSQRREGNPEPGGNKLLPDTTTLPAEDWRLLDFRFRSEKVELPLGWILSRAGRAEIQRQLGVKAGGLGDAIDKLNSDVEKHNMANGPRWLTAAHNAHLIAAVSKILGPTASEDTLVGTVTEPVANGPRASAPLPSSVKRSGLPNPTALGTVRMGTAGPTSAVQPGGRGTMTPKPR